MYYFASDIHLGLEAGRPTAEREKLLVRWLDEVSADAEAIFLVGDVFDFWFEYRRAVPKGFTRLLGKLSELTDRGISVHFFTGNHDLWAFDYLHTECGLTLHCKPYEIFELYEQKVLVGHGDVLGKRDVWGRLLSRMFRARTTQCLFSLMHPNTGLRFGQWWSGSSRKSKPIRHTFRAANEPVVRFAAEYLAGHPDTKLFVCGHIHCAEIYPLGDGSRIAFLGEWFENPTYGRLAPDGTFTLNAYPHPQTR